MDRRPEIMPVAIDDPTAAIEQAPVVSENVPAVVSEVPTRNVFTAIRDFVSERVARSKENSLRYAETCERRAEQHVGALAAGHFRQF